MPLGTTMILTLLSNDQKHPKQFFIIQNDLYRPINKIKSVSVGRQPMGHGHQAHQPFLHFSFLFFCPGKQQQSGCYQGRDLL